MSKPMTTGGLFARILGSHRAWLIGGVLMAMITIMANVALMSLSGWFITAMAAAGAGGAAINYFTPAAIIRGLAMLRTGGRYAERLVTHEATFRVIADLRVWLFRRLQPLAPGALADLHSGELLDRLQKDIDRLDGVYLRMLLPVLAAALALVVFALFLGSYGLSYLGGVALGWGIAGVLVPLWIQSRTARPAAAQVLDISDLRRGFLDSLQGVGDLINAGAMATYRARIRDSESRLGRAQDRVQFWSSLGTAGVPVAAGLAAWGVLILAVPAVHDGALNGPQLAMLSLFALASFEAVAALPNAFGLWGETRAALARIVELVTRPPAVAEADTPVCMPSHNGLRFDSIRLGYGDGEPLLDGFDLEVAPGGRVLITGPSGVGKSSLINLLLRFRDPDAGRVLLGESDVRGLDGEALRAQIALVPQTPYFFSASIRENLLIADPGADDARLIADFIHEQAEGLDTWMGDTGVKVSGGQARRLAVARALLKRAPLFVMDEPTEGLDTQTAHALMARLDKELEGCTVLVISHREVAGMRFDGRVEVGRVRGEG
ncbi:MAG: thiol reductant ABC exporter subunit CydC [Gammaproteobacteria bacterium]